MSLRKIDIVESIYERLEIPKKDCTRIVESLFEIVKDDLGHGNDVKISGFGKWVVRAKRERKGRDPRTGADLVIDARRTVTFKPSPLLRDSLNCQE